MSVSGKGSLPLAYDEVGMVPLIGQYLSFCVFDVKVEITQCLFPQTFVIFGGRVTLWLLQF